MNSNEPFLIALVLIFGIPCLIWRLGRTEYYAPLVVVQIITGLLLGPGVLGGIFPSYYQFVFTAPVVQSLNGIAWWGVMLFVWIAGIELDFEKTWRHRGETTLTAGFALGAPLLLGAAVAMAISTRSGWVGPDAQRWQFAMAVGMSCAVTALPILMLFMDKLDILRQPLGQRILRYASVDDIAIWGVLAVVLMDWQRVGRQLAFLAVFALFAWGARRLMPRIPERDRWYAALVMLAICGFGADWAGLHFMVGAFLCGAAMNAAWFRLHELDLLRHYVLLLMMPVFFLSTGLRTQWTLGGTAVILVAAALLAAAVAGKLLGVHLAGRILRWAPGESSLIGWLLQTKALIMIIFANILLDTQIITNDMFTALLLMAAASTMLTIPMVSPKLARLRARPCAEPPGTEPGG